MNTEQIIKRLAGDMRTYSLVAKVKSVDEDALTCTVEPLGFAEESEMTRVRLHALPATEQGVVLVPKVGSFVVISRMSEETACVVVHGEVDKVLSQVGEQRMYLTTDGVELGKETSQEPAVKGDTLNENIEELTDAVKSLSQALTTFSSSQGTAVASSGVLAPLAPAYTALGTEMGAIQAQISALVGKLSQHLAKDTKLS